MISILTIPCSSPERTPMLLCTKGSIQITLMEEPNCPLSGLPSRRQSYTARFIEAVFGGSSPRPLPLTHPSTTCILTLPHIRFRSTTLHTLSPTPTPLPTPPMPFPHPPPPPLPPHQPSCSLLANSPSMHRCKKSSRNTQQTTPVGGRRGGTTSGFLSSSGHGTN